MIKIVSIPLFDDVSMTREAIMELMVKPVFNHSFTASKARLVISEKHVADLRLRENGLGLEFPKNILGYPASRSQAGGSYMEAFYEKPKKSG